MAPLMNMLALPLPHLCPRVGDLSRFSGTNRESQVSAEVQGFDGNCKRRGWEPDSRVLHILSLIFPQIPVCKRVCTWLYRYTFVVRRHEGHRARCVLRAAGQHSG